MEVEPSIAKQYKCHRCCSCKNYRGKGWRVETKCLCIIFWLTRRSQDRGKGHPIAQATSYCLLPDTFWLRASKNAFKVGSVKFTVTAFHCEERMHQTYKQPRDLSTARQKSRALTTQPEPPNKLPRWTSTWWRRSRLMFSSFAFWRRPPFARTRQLFSSGYFSVHSNNWVYMG